MARQVAKLGSFFIVGSLVLLLGNLSLYAQEGKVSLEVGVDNPRPTLNEKVRLRVKLSWEGDSQRYEFSWPEEPKCRNLQIVGNSVTNQQTAKAGVTNWVKEFDYILKPIEEGEGGVGPVSLTYTDLQTEKEYSLKSRAIGIEVLPSPKEGKGTPLLFILGFFVVIGGASLSALLVRKRGKPPQEPTEEPICLERRKLQELEEVRRGRISGDFKAYYSSIAQILREYIEEKYGIGTKEVTTYDIINSLRAQEVDEGEVKTVEEILAQCDLVKFASHQPSEEDLDSIWLATKGYLEKREE